MPLRFNTAIRSVVALAVIITCSSIAAPTQAQDLIHVHGSDTMITLNRELTTEYAKQHKGVEFEVVGGGSETGIRALMEGSTDIAAASRAMKESELAEFERRTGSRPIEIVIASDGLGIYVHSNNPIRGLTLDQIRDVLTGKITNWRDIGGRNRPIVIYTRNRDSGTRTYVERNILGDSVADNAIEVATTELLAAAVARNQGAIGYGGIAYTRGVNILRVSPTASTSAYWPSRENVASGDYPLSRPLFYYLNPASVTDELTRFVDWVLSEAGQKVVGFVGYYPAPPPGESSSTASDGDAVPSALQLTPDTVARYGFDVDVIIDGENPADPDAKRTITIRFDPKGAAIHQIGEIILRLGTDAEVPLTLNRAYTIEFLLRPKMLQSASLMLIDRGAPMDGNEYQMMLSAFESR